MTRSPYVIFGAIAAVIIVVVTWYLSYIMHFFLAYLIAVNTVTFIMYAYDKAIAGSGRLRIPEWVLHGLAIIGGSPFALAAQKTLRHKTVKGSFQFVYWAIVTLQILLLGKVYNIY